MTMTADKVWLRFEKKSKSGAVMKLKIQDLPPERMDEAIDIRVKYFARDEIVHKATGLTKNPEAIEQYRAFLNMFMHEPNTSTVMCCEENRDKDGDIMGISTVSLEREDFKWDELVESAKNGSKEVQQLINVFQSSSEAYKPMKELNLDSYLDDHSILVMPDYRGRGIAQQFLKTRRLMCAELGVPKTGGWMTGHGTQIAAARDGWETVFEVKYDDLAHRHNLVFEDAPKTMKYMIAGPLKRSRIESLVNE